MNGVGVSALSDAAEKLAASKVYEQDDRTLDQKYAGATLSQLVAAESLLKERRDSDRDRIFKERSPRTDWWTCPGMRTENFRFLAIKTEARFRASRQLSSSMG